MVLAYLGLLCIYYFERFLTSKHVTKIRIPRLSDSYDVHHDVPLQPRLVCYTAPKQPYPQK